MFEKAGSIAKVPATMNARAHLNIDMMLAGAALLFSVIMLPIGYAAVLPEAQLASLATSAFSLPILLPALANAAVMLSSIRLKGRFDRKLAASLSRAILVHGSTAMLVLLARLDYSNQIMLLAMAVSMVLGPLVVWLRHDAYPPRIGLLCPPGLEALDLGRQHLVGRVEEVCDPSADLTAFDFLLTPNIASLPPSWATAVSRAMVSGTPVRHLADYTEERLGLTCVDHFDPEHLSAGGITSYRARKRVLDIILVLAALPIALVLIAVAASLIAVTMGRPVLFIQERVGRGGNSFRMLKLRTMRPISKNGSSSTANSNDAMRITPVGKVLRKYRIDELPQLFNVLVGDMSIVGPRPEWKALSDAYVSEFPVYAYRQLVRPGITGWAQVRSGYAADLAETRTKVGFDIFYIKNFSFALDVQILIRTVWTLISADGAR